MFRNKQLHQGLQVLKRDVCLDLTNPMLENFPLHLVASKFNPWEYSAHENHPNFLKVPRSPTLTLGHFDFVKWSWEYLAKDPVTKPKENRKEF